MIATCSSFCKAPSSSPAKSSLGGDDASSDESSDGSGDGEENTGNDGGEGDQHKTSTEDGMLLRDVPESRQTQEEGTEDFGNTPDNDMIVEDNEQHQGMMIDGENETDIGEM